MSKEIEFVAPDKDEQTKLEVRSVIVKNKWVVLNAKFTFPRHYFRHYEALTHFGGFPTPEEYIKQNLPNLIAEYCAQAKARLTEAGRPDFTPAKQRSNSK